MKRLTVSLFATLASLALAGPVHAAGDAAAGKSKIAVCMACHGQDGQATQPIYPNIGGQNEKYLVDALTAYKSGARNNPLMKPMVMGLSETDIADVAAYYASQPACK